MCEKCVNPFGDKNVDYYQWYGPKIHLMDWDDHWFKQVLDASGRKPHFIDLRLVGHYIENHAPSTLRR